MTTARSAGLRPAAGRVGTRVKVPAARAVAGGFAIAAAAVLVFAAYLGTRPGTGTPELVASAPLAAGTRLGPGDLRVTDLHLPGATAATAYADPAALVGRTLAVGLAPGELLTSGELTPLGATPRLRPVPLTVPATDLVDLVPGERVDVLETLGSAPHTTTTIVLRGAELIGISQPTSTLESTDGSQVVTLGVSDLADVEATLAADHGGTIDVVVAEPGDGSGLGAGATGPGGPPLTGSGR